MVSDRQNLIKNEIAFRELISRIRDGSNNFATGEYFNTIQFIRIGDCIIFSTRDTGKVMNKYYYMVIARESEGEKDYIVYKENKTELEYLKLLLKFGNEFADIYTLDAYTIINRALDMEYYKIGVSESIFAALGKKEKALISL